MKLAFNTSASNPQFAQPCELADLERQPTVNVRLTQVQLFKLPAMA